jgi:hypothetical protein
MTHQNSEPVAPAGQPSASRTVLGAVFAALVAVIAAAAVFLEVRGFRSGNLLDADIWDPQGMRRLVHYIAVFLVIAVPVMALVPWSFTGLVVALAAFGTALAAGPVAPLAVLFFLISACAIGSLLLGRSNDDSLPSQALATLLGTAVYIFLMTFLARLPVNYPLVWAVLLAAPIAADFARVRRRLAAFFAAIRHAELRSWGERAAAALLVFVLGMHWLVALKPEVGADALAMHLAIPANIAAAHRMTFEPSRYIWSVMPMGADWIYSIVFQLGGEAASRLVNFAMLLAVVTMLYGAARRWLSRSAALLVAALFASTPLVQLVTGSLFVENVLAALVLAMLAAIWRLGDTGNRRYLFAAAILAGSALTTKIGALPLVALALPFAAVEAGRHWRKLSPRPAGACAVALLLLVAAAAPTYAIAYHKTHNPLYPFLNRKFPSQYLDHKEEIVTGYHNPIGVRTLYDLTFNTSKFLEASDGSFGFQYLLLAPLALAGLLAIRSRPAVSATVIALAAAYLTLRSDSNARYIYAALPLATVPFAALLGWTASHNRLLYRALIACAVLCAGLNIYFLPASGWWHRDFYSPYTFARHGAGRYLEIAAPERLVIRRYNQIHPGSALLLASDTNIADVQGDVYENSWHQWNVAIAIQHAADVSAMQALFDQWKVESFIAPVRRAGTALQPPLLRDFLDSCTAPEYQLGGFTLSRTTGECRVHQPPQVPMVVDKRPVAAVPAGRYDDADSALHFDGDWEQNRTFSGPYRNTITFTARAGAGVRFAFIGKAVTYMFTRTFNRGFADIRIDGFDCASIDLYSAKTQWRASRKFEVTPGAHTIEVRVAGRKSPESSGQFVDVDGFAVE